MEQLNRHLAFFLIVILVGIVFSNYTINIETSADLIELPWAAGNFYPQPDSVDVPLDTNISISFGRPPSIANMTIYPEVPIEERTFESVYLAGGKYTFHLADLLKPSTTYNVTMTYGQETASEGFAPLSTRTWNFTTTAQSIESSFPLFETVSSAIVVSVVLVFVYYLKRKYL